MSYDIIKSIGITKDRVFITSTSNNWYPRTYERWECEPLSKMLVEQGKETVIKEILKEYWSGNFQAGTKNIYSRTVSSFKENNPNFNWDNVGYDFDYKTKEKKPRKYSYEELKEKLYNSYKEEKNKPIVKGNFIIKLGNSYILQLKRNGATATYYKEWAKSFKYTRACDVMRRFKNSNPELIKVEN